MVKTAEVLGLWKQFLAEKGLAVEEYDAMDGTKEAKDLWWEFWQRICEQDEKEKQRLKQAIAEMPESFKDLPLKVYTYSDTRPEDSWVDPATSKWETTLSDGLTVKQIAILRQLTKDKDIQPIRFEIDVRHLYNEYRRPHYQARIIVRCWDKKEKHNKLIEKYETTYIGYAALKSKNNWIP